MKLRNGFVSNSSTSSFLIYGANVNESDMNDTVLERNGIERDWDWTEQAEALADKLGLGFEYGRDSEYEGVYIGSDPTRMDDDQTMGDWKSKIEDKIKEAFGNKPTCSWHEDAWRDG